MKKESITNLIKKYNTQLKEVVIDSNLLQNIDHLIIKQGFNNKNILLISDNNLEIIADNLLENIKNNKVSKLILQNPVADDKNIELIANNINDADLILAVGSGTINDLCKITSYQHDINYMIFATAASMNGYASANASIAVKNHKKSLKAQQPLAIFCDLDILSNSPIDLIKAGIGDSLCYYSCYFDWFLSHLILGTEFNEELFHILAPYQDQLIKYNKNHFRDKDFMKNLIEILIISGLTMYIGRGSYSASQSEHLIAHFLDMKYPDLMDKYFHGQKIAVTTITTMQKQNDFLQKNNFSFKSYDHNLDYFIKLFNLDRILAQECFLETSNKAKIVKERVSILEISKLQNILRKTMINMDDLLQYL